MSHADGQSSGDTTRLSALDTSYIAMDRLGVPMNVGGVIVIANAANASGPVTLQRLRDRISSRLPEIPRLRQRLYELPVGTGRPVWADDPDFDVDDHVTAASVVSLDDVERVARYVGAHHFEPHDLESAPWHITLLSDPAGHTALYLNFHHAFVDGLRGIALVFSLFDQPAIPRVGPIKARDVRDRKPHLGDLVAAAQAAEIGATIRRQWEWTIDTFDPLATAQQDQRMLDGALSFLKPPPPTPLASVTTGRRRVTFRRLDAPMFAIARRRHGVDHATLVLASVGGAMSRLFRARGQECSAIRSLVPIANSRGSIYGNDAAFVVIDLPTGEIGETERIRLTAARLADARSGQLPVTRMLLRRWDDEPAASAQVVPYFTAGDTSTSLVVSLLRWPRRPPSMFGHPFEVAYPAMPMAASVGLMLAVADMGGRLCAGLTADPGVLPESSYLLAAIDDAMAAAAG